MNVAKRLTSVRHGGLYDGEAVVMMYDENHEPESHIGGEILITWIFAISLVAVILVIVGMAG